MTIDIERTDYGYPILPDRVQLAHQYAAEARARNVLPTCCPICALNEKLPAVLNIIEAERLRRV